MKKRRNGTLRRRYGHATQGKIDSIMVVGRRWHRGGPGGTYHSAEIYVNGKHVHRIPFAYGYDSMYEQNAQEWLEKNGYIDVKHYANGGMEPLWRIAQDKGFAYSASATNVARKKDL